MSSSNADNYLYSTGETESNLPSNQSHSRLSLLGKELYDNIENLILDENTFGKYFKKRNIDKKTIYSSNKFKLNLDELNSNSASVENVLIEEKHKEILFKGEDDNDEKENENNEEEKTEKKEEKKINAEDMFNDIENDIEKNLQQKNNNENNDNNNNINDGKNNKIEETPDNSTLVQDISDYNQEYKDMNNIFAENDVVENPKKKKNKDMDNIFDILSEDENEKEKENKEKNTLEETAKPEKEKEQEKEQEKKKDILKEEYYPIDIIEEAEKYYNLSNESKEDLYPLNTYQKNNGLSIEFLKFQDPNIRTDISGIVNVIGIDSENNLYICTNNGKIIKKERKGEILMKSDKYSESISCIDIVDNTVVTGDENGNIAIWVNNSYSRVLQNVNDNNKIICVKILELVNNQITFIFSDIKGNLNIIKSPIHKGDFKNEELEYEYTPVYNILIFPNTTSFIKSEKLNIIIILVSPQNIGIYRLYLDKPSLEKLKVFEYFYGEKGKFYFDVSAGKGFPPLCDIGGGRVGSESSSSRRGSISSNITIGIDDEETPMIAVSYGTVLQLFGFRVSDKNEIYFKQIGFIINDKPILRNCFITNSMIALMTDNLNIKLINTYDFIPKVFNPQDVSNVSKNFLISYECLNINNSGLNGDIINYSVNNKKMQKSIYNNKLITGNKSLYFISDEGINIQQIVLSNYDDVLNSLCEKEEYIRMLWLLSIILNKNSNLLNKQLNKIEKNYSQNNKKKLCDLYLMRFFITKTIPELQNKNEIYARMLLEFFMETDTFEILSEFLALLTGSGLDQYIYSNLTKYMANGNLYEIILNQEILKNYIDYCLNKNEKLLLNKVLLKLNLDTLLQKDILKIIYEKELINPYIYTRIKNIKMGKTDYFLPVEYLDSVFKKEYLEKKNEEMIKQNLTPEQLELYNIQLLQKKEMMKEEIEKNLNSSKDYKKLIKEHNMDYFNEDTFSCHEYIGHKFLWYCNKCILGKEYPNDNLMSPIRFKETAIKILSYLITPENIKIYSEFDSYTYLQIISKYFLDEKLFKFITGMNITFTKEEKEFINTCLGDKASDEFNAFFVYTKIKEGMKDIEVNRFFFKYDFYVMTCEICEKVKDFIFEQKDIMDTLLYFSELDLNDYNEENDPFNCHRKIEGEKNIQKFKEKIEKYMIILLDYLKFYNLLTEEYVKTLVKKRRIIGYKKLYFYLCEESHNYKECLELHLLEYEKNKDLFSEKEKKELFNWIKKIHEYTSDLENSPKNTEKIQYHEDFKKLLLQYLNQLCTISMEELSKIMDECYKNDDEKEELIRHLGEGQSSALQLKYLDQYFKLREKDMNENIEKYTKYLDMEIDILIKSRNKRRIKKLLMDYKILCNDNNFKKLKKHNMNDCCIYICQYQGKVKEGVEMTIKEVQQKYKNILEVLNKPHYNPIIIDIELKEMYKYFELGLDVCRNNFLEEEKVDKHIDDSWLDLFNTACEFKIDFYPHYESNKNNIKTREHKKIFNGLQSCIQLILETMSDYIGLNSLVEIISTNCEKWKTIEFYTFLDKSLYSFRRSEQIYNCAQNLMTTSILIQYDDLALIKTLGKYIFLEQEKCNFCKLKIKSSENNSYYLFECGHKYHVGCCWEELDVKVCYVCRMNEIEGEEEKSKLKEAQPPPEMTYLEKEKQEELDKKNEEKIKRSGMKKKLNALEKLRKKRREINNYLIKNDIYN